MIQYLDVDQCQGLLQGLRKQLVGTARFPVELSVAYAHFGHRILIASNWWSGFGLNWR